MDEIDITQDRMEKEILQAREAYAKDIPEGKEGECIDCEEHSFRLIRGRCAKCRDINKKYLKINGKNYD